MQKRKRTPIEHVVLVDEHGVDTGTAEKLAAHRGGGRLHRAFSVFIFDAAANMLLQRRAPGKYHFPSLWSNACCSHPRRGETPEQAAHRRLREELGFDTPLAEVTQFIYRATAPNGLVEHELDHVFRGVYTGGIVPDPAEVDAWRWVALAALRAELAAQPEQFTPWFRIIAASFPAWFQGGGQ